MLSSGAAICGPRTQAFGVADAMIECLLKLLPKTPLIPYQGKMTSESMVRLMRGRRRWGQQMETQTSCGSPMVEGSTCPSNGFVPCTYASDVFILSALAHVLGTIQYLLVLLRHSSRFNSQGTISRTHLIL